jgi:hypothetical protein
MFPVAQGTGIGIRDSLRFLVRLQSVEAMGRWRERARVASYKRVAPVEQEDVVTPSTRRAIIVL